MIETSQGRIAVCDSKPQGRGDDPTVIFIHGHCTNQTFFSAQVDSSLLQEYRLITLDLPGYGKSDPPIEPQNVYSLPGYAEVVVEVIDFLSLNNIVVVGWSLGGHVGLELTQKLDQLKGLLITGTPPIEISEEGLAQGFRIPDLKILECFGKGNLSREEAEWLATVSGYDYTEEKQFLVDAILNTDEGAKTIYPASIVKGIGLNELDIVGRWPRPIAVIAGENDAAINNEYIIHRVKFRNLWKNKVHIIRDTGHAVHMENAEEFNRILNTFLQDVFCSDEMNT